MSHTVLLTGFGPFPGVPENATAKLVPAIAERAAREFPHCNFVCEILPVEWEMGPAKAARLYEDHRPNIVLHFGVSERAEGFVIETVARNRCQIAFDARGALPALELIDAAAGTVLPVSLPCDAIVQHLSEMTLPASLSDDAGGYLCNAVLFGSLLAAQPGQRVGFVHVPDGLADGTAKLSMEQAIAGGIKIIAACLSD